MAPRAGRSTTHGRACGCRGTLQVDGQPRTVSGEFWFDRQWGRDMANPWLRWDWFSPRLDDGTTLMLYKFRDADPPVAFGTYVPDAGAPLTLTGDDFLITPNAWWTSPHTGVTYPVSWDIQVISQDLILSVSAAFDDQELDARASTLNVYWEGLCALRGVRGDQPVAGPRVRRTDERSRAGRAADLASRAPDELTRASSARPTPRPRHTRGIPPEILCRVAQHQSFRSPRP